MLRCEVLETHEVKIRINLEGKYVQVRNFESKHVEVIIVNMIEDSYEELQCEETFIYVIFRILIADKKMFKDLFLYFKLNNTA